MERVITCVVCPNSCNLHVKVEGEEFYIEGNLCHRGKEFAINEIKNPKRSLCTTVKTIFKEMPRLSVRTDGEILKSQIEELMNEISKVVVTKPLSINEIVLEDVAHSGINVIATTDLKNILSGSKGECTLHNNYSDVKEDLEKIFTNGVSENSE